MNLGRDALTYFVGLLTMAIILRNSKSVSDIIMALSRGARSVSSVLLVGSTPGGDVTGVGGGWNSA